MCVRELCQHLCRLVQTLLQFLLYHKLEHHRDVRFHGQFDTGVSRVQLFQLDPEIRLHRDAFRAEFDGVVLNPVHDGDGDFLS